MTTSGAGTFFDGLSTARHDVTIELASASLIARDQAGRVVADWPYAEIDHLSAPEGVLRLGRAGDRVLARLEVRNPELAAAIDDLSTTVDRSGRTQRRGRMRVVAWSFAATVSLIFLAVFGVPALATRLAPYVPYSVEHRLGAAVDAQVRTMLDTRHQGARFECGKADGEKAGQRALETVVARMEIAAALPIPLNVVVVRRREANAITLPGGNIYVFEGLISQAKTADEFAGVLAHEMGHVARRDGTRSVLQAAGLSFLFGMLLGDFVGGGAVVVAAKTVLQLSYSREVETAADAYAVDLMIKLAADPQALATMLARIGGGRPGVSILVSHPATEERVKAIKAKSLSGAIAPILPDADWAQLKQICSGPTT